MAKIIWRCGNNYVNCHKVIIFRPEFMVFGFGEGIVLCCPMRVGGYCGNETKVVK